MSLLLDPQNPWRAAQFLVRACNAAYDDAPASHDDYPLLGLAAPDLIVEEDTQRRQGFVAANERQVVIAIRGTEELDEWVSNAAFTKPHESGSGRVHRGFLTGLADIYESIQNTLQQPQYRGKELWITGHSRGAALAVLLARQLFVDYGDDAEFADLMPTGIHAFAPPRVGDLDFYHHYPWRDRTWLFLNDGDPVPLLPPSPYVHVAVQQLMRNGKATEVDFDDWSTLLAHPELWLVLQRVLRGQLNLVQAHLMEAYIEEFDAMLGS